VSSLASFTEAAATTTRSAAAVDGFQWTKTLHIVHISSCQVLLKSLNTAALTTFGCPNIDIWTDPSNCSASAVGAFSSGSESEKVSTRVMHEEMANARRDG
jgi:hypothetical protein